MYYVYAISSLCRNYIYVGLTDSTARQEELFARRTCLSGDMSSADSFIDPLDRCGLLFAGAKTIIMSLWNVSDNVTQAMMYKFYTFWLSGMTKKAAFDQARNELQKIYAQPYYWAGFVMLD
ncbi:MAG: CHAT domain-containing protein [Bacteroidales bacterium]|nr:CHAT domain-containing protein [Bacteroidales bacterium]MDY6035958.1 CHAT domain-containing protein [Paludibacteraceae bacterium]